jgi:FkbM family methyltransferase
MPWDSASLNSTRPGIVCCDMTAAFRKLMQQGFAPTHILDIGANQGGFTRYMREHLFPSAEYLMLDAEPHHITKHWGDLLKYPNVHGASAVLDEVEHNVPWFTSESGGHTMHRETTGFHANAEVETRRAKTLDSVVAENNRSGIAFELVKMDVQDAEVGVIRGGRRTLSRASVVMMEMSPEYNRGLPAFSQYISVMDTLGFIPFDFVAMHRPITQYLLQIDMIFVRRPSGPNRELDNTCKHVRACSFRRNGRTLSWFHRNEQGVGCQERLELRANVKHPLGDPNRRCEIR